MGKFLFWANVVFAGIMLFFAIRDRSLLDAALFVFNGSTAISLWNVGVFDDHS